MNTAPARTAREYEWFSSDAIIEQHSPTYGTIFVWPPNGPPELWSKYPWLITSQNGERGAESLGFKHMVKAAAVKDCLAHPAIIGFQNDWLWTEPLGPDDPVHIEQGGEEEPYLIP